MEIGDAWIWVVVLITIFLAAEIMGIVSAGHAIMAARTAQGAIAWAICLIIFPFIALPAYWIFGCSKFEGYVKARRSGTSEIHHVFHEAARHALDRGLFVTDSKPEHRVLERLVRMPFTKHTRVRLLVDGEETFRAIFAGIESARDYILVQFFIVHDDELGNELKSRLLAKVAEGVRIYFLYDEIGCHQLPSRFLGELRVAGVQIYPFHSNRRNRFQINFRNHRKIVVVDGRVAYVGGLNVGDEYMGRSERFGPWRDTHSQLEGPSVHAVQLSFLEDWFWATRTVPQLDWYARPAEGGDQNVLVLPTGPADAFESCGLFFINMINRARRRIWIASPYFVPDLPVISALQLAALREVDVRIMLPEKPDHLLIYLSSFSFLDDAELAGVKIYRYQPGFLHHKVLIVDDDLSAVGTANLDNRSFRLNFEITVLVDDAKFAAQMAEMFERDFSRCRLAQADELERRPLWFKVAVQVSRLLAPVQ